MIDDDLIEKAEAAAIERWGRTGSLRAALTAALEAVAADLYDVGYEAGRFDGECTSYTRPEDRPYRASEAR